jgi:hypothetical protein
MRRDSSRSSAVFQSFVVLIALIFVPSVLITAGCSRYNEEPPRDNCALAKAQSVAADAPKVVLVVDHTPASRAGLAMPPGLVDAVAGVQEMGVKSGKGSQIQVVPVIGASEYPPTGKPVSIDLTPGDTSQDGTDARKVLLQDCLPGLIDEVAPIATDTTDIVGGLLEAVQEKPAKVVVLSGGLNVTPSLDLRSVADPVAAADAVRAANPQLNGWNVPVVWFNLGEPSQPLSDQDRARLIAFWDNLFQGNLSNDTREGGRQTDVAPTPTR